MNKTIKNFIVYILALIVIFQSAALYLHHRYGRTVDPDFEIERKWLIDPHKIPYDLNNASRYDIVQTYLNFSPEIRLRKINGNIHILGIKTYLSEGGLSRTEHEYDISESEYNELIKKQEANAIYKTRYVVEDSDGINMQIDIFSGNLIGLAYMEIEFDSVEEAKAYHTPDWAVADVTDDLSYKNGYLARYGIPKSYYEYIKR